MSEAGPDPIIERVAEELSRPVPLGADFTARVMARVRAERPSMLASVAAWLAEPRAVAVSPLGGLALAAGVAGLVLAGTLSGSRLAGRGEGNAIAAPAAVAGAAHRVAFVLVAPGARSVALAGDFNGWDTTRTPLTRTAAGLWPGELPLAPGRYGYAFVVDGREFVADPAAPQAVDDFGVPTSVITVGAAVPAGVLPGGAL